jgi:transposase
VIYIGMDLHQKTTTWYACNVEGQRVGSGKVESNYLGWQQILVRFCEPVQVAIETGSITWFCVEQLRLLGVEPVVVDARHFKLIADSRKKSDRRDARTLAEALFNGTARQCTVTVPSERARRGRTLLQARKTIVEQGTASRNAIKGLLRGCGIQIAQTLWRHPEELLATLADNDRIPDWMRPLLLAHSSVWLETQRQRASLDRQITEELGQWREAAHLETIPGFGPLVTLAVVSAIDVPQRFHRGKQVASYAGLPPSVRNSGQSTRHGGITHQGRSLLRHALTQAAHSALRSRSLSESHRTWARAIDARRGRQIAVTALARRLIVVAHQMWLTGETYRTQPLAAAAA